MADPDESLDDQPDVDEFDEGEFLCPPGSDPEDETDDDDESGETDDAGDWSDNPFDGPASPEY